MTDFILTDDEIERFIESFFGYGTWDAPYWFVGKEEGGGNDWADVSARVRTWHERGERELEDVAEYHRALGLGTKYFKERPPLQPTWSRLLRVLFSATGRDANREALRRYQSAHLGRPDGETLLTELLPLPSPSASRWLYGAYSSLDYLADRDRYRAAVAPRRAAALRARIARHRPHSVIFYGSDALYRDWWREIAGIDLEPLEVDGRRLFLGGNNHTRFLIIDHPTAFGITSAFLSAAGRQLASPDDRNGG